jgi:hypothetical protein
MARNGARGRPLATNIKAVGRSSKLRYLSELMRLSRPTFGDKGAQWAHGRAGLFGGSALRQAAQLKRER